MFNILRTFAAVLSPVGGNRGRNRRLLLFIINPLKMV